MSTAPNRVAVETLRGRITAGRVVNERVVASARTGPTRQYLVDVDGATLWVDAADTRPSDSSDGP
jgi:hypothetical protein